MTYSTTNARAARNPLRSIPIFRPIAALGPAFAAQHVTADQARILAVQRLQQAQIEIGEAWEAYGDAKAAVGECNKMRAKNRHDRALYSDRAVARRLSAAFGAMNRLRARFLRAHKALAAAEALAQSDVSVEVIDLRTLNPLDMETVAASVERTGRAVVVSEGPLTAGVAAELAARISEECFDHLEDPVIRIAGEDIPIPVSPSLEGASIPTPELIVATVQRMLRR